MASLSVHGGARLAGRAVAPPDKSIFHRALILAGLGDRRALVGPLSAGADNRATLEALVDLGVRIDEGPEGLWVHGVGGPKGLKPPSRPLDCANSGSTLRMLTGVLAAAPFETTLVGDSSLSRRPMSRLLPLERLGAQLSGVERGGQLYPPLRVRGGPLRGARIALPIASAQVKTALLLAGLWAEGPTTVWEPARSRDHTERLLRRLGLPLAEAEDGALTLTPTGQPFGLDHYPVAPDFSSAAFLLGAALLTGSPEVEVETGLNPTRTGLLEMLTTLGARVQIETLPEQAGEPIGRVRIEGPLQRGGEFRGEQVLRAIDEIPLLAALATQAPGRTRIRDAGELRVKESDRLASTARLLRAFGAEVVEHPDGLELTGPVALRPTRVSAEGDHRIGMTAALLGLLAPGTTVVEGAEVIGVSFPGFTSALESLGASVEFSH